MSALFQLGDFTLASGVKSNWKIECDGLTDQDWDALAFMLVERLYHPFGITLGVPRGGLPLAEALLSHRDPGSSRVLVVDDVWTTGGSMQRYIDAQVTTAGPIDRAVIFARTAPPSDVTALFSIRTPRRRES